LGLFLMVWALGAFVLVEHPEERIHFLMYGVMVTLWYQGFRQSLVTLKRRTAIFLSTLITAAVGILDEVLQIWVPDRVFDPRDIQFNVIAALLGGLCLVYHAYLTPRIVSRSVRKKRTSDSPADPETARPV